MYEKYIELVSDGVPFKVDFKNKSLRVGRKTLIKDGIFDVEIDVEPKTQEECLLEIDRLYKEYANSLPSERSDNKKHTYFKAKEVRYLTDEQMCFGKDRELAQFELESFILIHSLKGNFKWDNNWGWFYKSPNNKSLIILKEWIV